MFEKLVHVGLTGTEAKIYLMLIDITKAQAGVLARKTGIHRRSVYDALDRLIEKGLVSYIVENGNRFYIAEDPKRIQELIDAKKEEIYSILPQMTAKFLEHKDKQETLFYRGKDGLKSVFEDQLRKGEDVYVIGGHSSTRDIMKFYWPHYQSKRVANKQKLHLLFACDKKVDLKSKYAVARYLPAKYKSIVSTNIYADRVAIIIWLEHDPVAIVIKQPDVAKAYKGYFDQLWEIAKKK